MPCCSSAIQHRFSFQGIEANYDLRITQNKTLDVITLFHKPTLPASIRVHTLLKQISAHASETATEDQATDHTEQNKLQRTEFELNVTEDPPTKDQMRTILEYVGGKKASQLIDGARDEADALKKLGEGGEKFRRPVVSAVACSGGTEWKADIIADCGLEQW